MSEQTTEKAQKRGLSADEWERITEASFRSGAPAWRAEVEQIIREHESRAAAQALRSAALSIPMGPKPDPADYLRECADVICPPGRACPTCVHPEGYDRLSGPCPTCHGDGVIPPAGGQR